MNNRNTSISTTNIANHQVIAPNNQHPIRNNVTLIPTSKAAIYNDINTNNIIVNHIFPYEYFNPMQSKCFTDVYFKDNNLIIGSPTGSGKTLIAELSILRLKLQHKKKKSKIIYISPIKALCNEKYNDWKNKFNPLDIKVIQYTGDSAKDTIHKLSSYDIIITTPEKIDSLTHRWTSYAKFLDNIELIIIDEIHLLNEINRGAILEGLITRFKITSKLRLIQSKCNLNNNKEYPIINLRFLGLSATIINIEDISLWLDAIYYKFDNSFRPCPLISYVKSYPMNAKNNHYLFANSLNYKLNDLIMNYSNGKPVLIFCATKKETISAANQIYNNLNPKNIFIDNPSHQQRLYNIQQRISNKTLKKLIIYGIAFHSTILDYNDRNIVENLYRNNEINIICSTTTLALGVNLPAYLVIIKGTKKYQQNMGYIDYSFNDINQMIGRSGRPNYDTDGVSIIMTNTNSYEKYYNISNNSTIIESICTSILEHFNAECVINTFNDIIEAVNWFKNTFLYIRALKNSSLYNEQIQSSLNLLKISNDVLQLSNNTTNEQLNQFCNQYISKIIQQFELNKLISIDQMIIHLNQLN